jgi:hypothetical protein
MIVERTMRSTLTKKGRLLDALACVKGPTTTEICQLRKGMGFSAARARSPLDTSVATANASNDKAVHWGTVAGLLALPCMEESSNVSGRPYFGSLGRVAFLRTDPEETAIPARALGFCQMRGARQEGGRQATLTSV